MLFFDEYWEMKIINLGLHLEWFVLYNEHKVAFKRIERLGTQYV
ncbi:hypothetical protein DJ93_3745 [Bacillus clarus]|uniref:Uncharacterized protein n=1 Tax=Bacillus clarus TaxID=2338372 RepID=A0A090YWE6_9BACI|nr:hypothetical protein DJ93_3745 [Bacillus clarus]